MKKKVLVLLSFVVLVFASCKKDTITTSASPSLKARWNLTSIVYYQAGIIFSNYTGKYGDYADFKTTGKYERSFDGVYLESTFSINGNVVNIGGSDYNIISLSNYSAVINNTQYVQGIKVDTKISLYK